MPSITPAQIRGARRMLDWSMVELAKAAGVSISTVKRAHDGGTSLVSPITISQIQDALEAAGVQFLVDDGKGPGMRLRIQPASSLPHFV